MPVDACIGRVNEVGATAINCQRYAYYACASQRKLMFAARDSTSQIDVKRSLKVATVDFAVRGFQPLSWFVGIHEASKLSLPEWGGQQTSTA
jgi:hypothetical protein